MGTPRPPRTHSSNRTSFARLEPSIPRHNLTVPEIEKIRRSPATGRAAFWKNPEKIDQHLGEIQQNSGKICDAFCRKSAKKRNLFQQILKM